MLIKIISMIILACVIPAAGFSQKKKQKQDDAVTIMKEFAAVCNLYKKMPLRLGLEYTQTATIKTSVQDSVSVKAEFYLTDNGAYIRFGNTEQVVSDSMVLMVSLDQPVMMVFHNPEDVKTRLSSYMGLQMSDSTLQRLGENYTASWLASTGAGEKIIQLKNKIPLTGTDIVKETITVRYKTESKEPAEVIYIRRTLIPVDKRDVPAFSSIADRLVTVKENSFLVNERRSVFAYKTIDHDRGIRLPVAIADRIRKNEQGKIVPVSGFEHYYVNVE